MKLKLEVFETASPFDGTVVLQASDIEDARLQSYEKGYAAGWEDAVATTAEEKAQLTAEIANNLQHLAFTYREARGHLLAAIKPVLLELSTRLLPEVAREAVAPVVLDTLMPLLDDVTEQPIEITLNPASRPAVERLLAQAAGLPLRIEEEPTLAEGQIYLRLGPSEYRVDLDQAIREIVHAVHDFFDYSEKDEGNG